MPDVTRTKPPVAHDLPARLKGCIVCIQEARPLEQHLAEVAAETNVIQPQFVGRQHLADARPAIRRGIDVNKWQSDLDNAERLSDGLAVAFVEPRRNTAVKRTSCRNG